MSYAVGWDLRGRAAVGPLSREQAEARDAEGEPYVMVHRVAGRREPVEVHLVDWGASYVGVWGYDEWGRRKAEADWRLLEEERVFLLRVGAWLYVSAEQEEFGGDVTWVRQELYPDGKGRKVVERPRGGATHTPADIDEGDRWLGRGALGVGGEGWLLVSGETGTAPVVVDAEEAEPAEPVHEPQLWVSPRPAEPAYLTELFTVGTKFSTDVQPEMTVVGVREIARLRVPSGRLVVADPSADGRELVQGFAPGTYPMQEAVVGYEYDFMGEHVETEDPVAVRLLLRDEPVAAWELALASGEDVRLLHDGGGFGFGTDGALGSFADASGWDTHVDQVMTYYRRHSEKVPVDFVADGHLRSVDESTGSDLICFPTAGDGGYPVWLGRSASGEAVSFVVVTDYLSDLRPL